MRNALAHATSEINQERRYKLKFFTGKKQSNPGRFVIREWKHLKVGDVIEIKGAYFLIHRMNPMARQIILSGIQDPTVKHNGKP